jgi:hypothetical protein
MQKVAQNEINSAWLTHFKLEHKIPFKSVSFFILLYKEDQIFSLSTKMI